MSGDFIDLKAWQQGAQLATGVCVAVRRMRGPGAKALAEQLVRSATSVPANIAEGYGRGVCKDNCRYLKIARASAAEVESHLRIAAAAGYLPESACAPLIELARSVRYLTGQLLKSIERRLAAD